MTPFRAQAAGVVGLLVLLLIAFYFATSYVAIPWRVQGPSMEPALASGERVWIDLWSYRHRSPRVGEIVLFVGPPPSEARLIKRVAAPLPFPDDRPQPGNWGPADRRAGAGIRVLGDNREESFDSRHFGPVPRSRILGRVVK